jgi:hypothetical protein
VLSRRLPTNLATTTPQRFFAQHEFSAPHLLCCSDCEPLTLKELLAIADDDSLRRLVCVVAPRCCQARNSSKVASLPAHLC